VLDDLTLEDLKKIFEKANYVADDNILFSVYCNNNAVI